MYVPETIQLHNLFQMMRQHHTPIAIVVDEYGGTSGIVTLEDTLEEIVGNIEDEFDELHDDLYKILPDGSYRIQARMSIDDLNHYLHLNLPKTSENMFETLGGFLLARFQRIPYIGEMIEYHHWVFKIEDANARTINRVHILKQQSA